MMMILPTLRQWTIRHLISDLRYYSLTRMKTFLLIYVNHDHMVYPTPRKCLETSQVSSYMRRTQSYLTDFLPYKTIDRTFLMPPEEDGTRHRAKIIALIDSHLAENSFEKQPERVKFKCLVNDKCEEVVAYNDTVDYIEANDTRDGVWKFCCILDHKCVTRSDKNYMQCSVNVLIEWESGETSWQPLHRKDKAGIYDCDPVTVAIYARENNHLDAKAGNYLDSRRLRKPRNVSCVTPSRLSSKQAKLHSLRTKPIYMYGFEVPHNHEQAMAID